jgi:hypothetical protein
MASCARMSSCVRDSVVLACHPSRCGHSQPPPPAEPNTSLAQTHVYGSYGYGVNLDPVTTISRYYGPPSVGSRCQLHIGAQATTNRQAVGSIEIYCFSAQYVAVDLRLYQSKRNAWVWRSANYTHVWKYVPAGTWLVWDTDPGLCGSGFWQVDAQLAIYGHGRNAYFGPTGPASWFASQKKSFAAC